MHRIPNFFYYTFDNSFNHLFFILSSRFNWFFLHIFTIKNIFLRFYSTTHSDRKQTNEYSHWMKQTNTRLSLNAPVSLYVYIVRRCDVNVWDFFETLYSLLYAMLLPRSSSSPPPLLYSFSKSKCHIRTEWHLLKVIPLKNKQLFCACFALHYNQFLWYILNGWKRIVYKNKWCFF